MSPEKLRRWIREGKFAHIDGMDWDRRPGFQQQRVYSADWIRSVADELGITADAAGLRQLFSG